ncbi:hypothetical protein HPB47_015266 [Ixodes persulcatus]|uniref:Uncharacterized protein n=1 Tax=Ixodes persulcatus TaxID=34615 RepID=A0AC60QWG8_IXOPE|nr:hypothetical protein HPB47_015266 [Ixodes persulcatus]
MEERNCRRYGHLRLRAHPRKEESRDGTDKEHQEKFDVVLSCLCLKAASLDEATFRTVTQNVGDLIHEGGLLILCGVLGCHEYSVGGVKFPCLCLTPDTVKDALVQAGFQVNLWRCLDKPAPLTPTIDSAYVVAAQKF